MMPAALNSCCRLWVGARGHVVTIDEIEKEEEEPQMFWKQNSLCVSVWLFSSHSLPSWISAIGIPS